MKTSRQIATALVLIGGATLGWARLDPAARATLEPLGLGWLAGPAAEQVVAEEEHSGPPTVIAVAVTQDAVADEMTAIGDGRALRSVVLKPEVSGRVTGLPVPPGTRVEQGAVIMTLDDRVETIALERARLVRDDAQTTQDRAERLRSTGAVNELQVIAARLALQTAELELREAQLDLDRRTVRAPIPGHVGLVDIEIGDQVTAATDIAVIDDRSRILVEFRVPERFSGRIAVGDPLTAATLAAGAPEAVQGRVHAVDNRIDPASRSFRVQGEIENFDDRLRSGMAFRIAMRFPGAPRPAVAPLAIQWNSSGSYVWAVRGQRVERVPVRILQRDADRVLVEGALSPGDLVVSEGLQTLRPGQTVNVANPVAATASAVPQPGVTAPVPAPATTGGRNGGRDI